MSPVQFSRELAALIEGAAAEARRLLDVLAREKSALATNDSDSLTTAASEKSSVLAALELLEKDRRRLLQQFSIGATREEMHSLIERLARDTSTRAASITVGRSWQQLNTTLQQCREMNLANGKIVAAMQTRVQQALNLLRGGRGTVATYGRTGSTQLTGTGARELARA